MHDLRQTYAGNNEGLPNPSRSTNINPWTQPILWLPNQWITNMREFLSSINRSIILKNLWTIPQLQEYNSHIMNDFLKAKLPLKDLHTLNNCWMHLKVTSLAEIASLDGAHILTLALQQGNTTPSLQMISQSLHCWPHQPSPCKKAWLLWTHTIQSIYVKPGMTTLLKQLFSPWCPLVTPTHHWYAIYNPRQQAIITQYPNQLCCINLPTHKTQSHQYYWQCQPLNQIPSITYPVTLDHQKEGFWITQPIPPYKLALLPHLMPPPSELQWHIWTLLPMYTPELWSVLSCTTGNSPTALAEFIAQAREPIFIVSNASLNAQKRSTFSWTISTPHSELWIGAGACPGTQCDAHSSCSEGYSLLATFIFLEKYLVATALPTPLPQWPSMDSVITLDWSNKYKLFKTTKSLTPHRQSPMIMTSSTKFIKPSNAYQCQSNSNTSKAIKIK